MALTKTGTDGIKDNAVTTAKIVDDAVTNAKMADNSVNSNNYVDGSINTAHVSNDAITGAKIQNSGSNDSLRAITTAHIKDDAVTTAKIPNDAVTYAKMQNTSNGVRFLGKHDGGGGEIGEITAAQARTMLNVADGATNSITTTINNNANNRVITGSDTANSLEAESGLIYNASNGRLGVNIGANSASARLSVVDDSSNEGFNVKHSNLTAGIGIGYDTIKPTGTNADNSLNIRSKGDGEVNIGTDGHTVASIESPQRNFRIHGNHQGWSTLQMDDQNYGWRRHIKRVNNGTNAVTTHNIARIKISNWGWGYFELRIYTTYYYRSQVSIGYVFGHGNGSDAYSIKRKDEKYTDTNSVGWSAEITKGTVSVNSPGQSNAYYMDLQCTIPNYMYAVAELITHSSFKMTDSEMSNELNCYRLLSP